MNGQAMPDFQKKVILAVMGVAFFLGIVVFTAYLLNPPAGAPPYSLALNLATVVVSALCFVLLLKDWNPAKTVFTFWLTVYIGIVLSPRMFESSIPQSLHIPSIVASLMTGIPGIIASGILSLAIILFRFGFSGGMARPDFIAVYFAILLGIVFVRLIFRNALRLIIQKQKENELLHAQNAAILQNASLGMIATDRDGVITNFNPAAELLLGWKAEELNGKKTPEIFHDPNEIAERAAELSLLLGKTVTPNFRVFVSLTDLGLPNEHEWTWIRKDGSRLPVLLSISAIRNETGTTTGYLGMASDITSRKLADRELEDSRRRMADIIEFLPDPTFVIDAEGRVIAWNRAIAELTGWPASRLLGKSDHEYALPFFGQRRKILIDLALANDPETEKKYLYIRRKGDTLFAESDNSILKDGVVNLWGISAPLFGPDGKVTGAIESIKDVTELKENEKQLRELNDNLEARVQEKIAELREKDSLVLQQSRFAAMGEMLSSIAHHWRQPLNALSVTVQNIGYLHQAGELSTKKLDSLVLKAKGIATQMSQTIDTFRRFLSPREGETCFRLGECLANAVKLADSFLAENRVKFTAENRLGDTGENLIEGREDEMTQVLLNLFSNSRDAFEERKVSSPEIRVCLEASPDGAAIRFMDNAGGITDEVLPRIFEPYFSTKPRLQGMGLGLYISRMIVEKNFGGTISACNGPEGAEFCIQLPQKIRV